MSAKDEGRDLELRQVSRSKPQEKQMGVRRLFKRLLEASVRESGPHRVIGCFVVTLSADGGAGLAYALTQDEAAVLERAVPEALAHALEVIRAASPRNA